MCFQAHLACGSTLGLRHEPKKTFSGEETRVYSVESDRASFPNKACLTPEPSLGTSVLQPPGTFHHLAHPVLRQLLLPGLPTGSTPRVLSAVTNTVLCLSSMASLPPPTHITAPELSGTCHYPPLVAPSCLPPRLSSCGFKTLI